MDIITIVGFSFFGIACFLSITFFIRNSFKDDGYLFLYFILLLLSYEVFYKTLIHSKIIYSFPSLYISGRFFNLMVYPILLFFIYWITRPNFKLKTRHWIIALITFFFVAFNYFPSLNLSISQKLKNLDLFYADTRPGPYNYWGNWQTFFIGTMIPLVFVLLTIYEFFHFKKKNKNAQKNALLGILLTVILLFFFFNLSSNLIYEKMEALSGWSMIEWPVDIFFLSIVLALLSVISLSVNSGSSFLPPAKYVSSSLHEESYDVVISQISKIITEKELYKETDFSLKRLAEEVNSNTRYLSQAINHKLGMRFNDYINEFRINEAKQQLLSTDNKNLTIEAIGKNCGFQSKSTFFRIFKKVTNLTPKQFINEQKRSSNL